MSILPLSPVLCAQFPASRCPASVSGYPEVSCSKLAGSHPLQTDQGLSPWGPASALALSPENCPPQNWLPSLSFWSLLTPKSQISSSPVKHPERLLTSQHFCLGSRHTSSTPPSRMKSHVICCFQDAGPTAAPPPPGVPSGLVLVPSPSSHKFSPLVTPFIVTVPRFRCYAADVPLYAFASTPSTPPHHLPALKSGMQANNRQTNCNKSELIIIDPQSVSRTISAFFPQHLHQFILSHPPSWTCSQPSDPFFERVPNISQTSFWPIHLLVLIFRGTLTSHSILGIFCKADLNFFLHAIMMVY